LASFFSGLRDDVGAILVGMDLGPYDATVRLHRLFRQDI
jgi:hypothetical protein